MKQESGKQESGRFSQQAINRIAEIAIARQLKQDVEIRVDISATLKQLAKGQIDAIAILIRGLILSGNLRTEEFQLDIGAVTVKPLSAVKGKIQLVHPSQGKLRVVIGENDLTAALNQGLSLDRTEPEAASPQSEQNQTAIRCQLADRAIRLNSVDFAAAPESIVLTPVPQPQGIDWQSSPDAAVPADWLSWLDRLLSLKDFEQKGLFLSIQEIDIGEGKLQILADALIQSFPPD